MYAPTTNNTDRITEIRDLTKDGLTVTRFLVTDENGELATYETNYGHRATLRFKTLKGATAYVASNPLI